MTTSLSTADKNLWTKRLLCQWLEGAQQALLDSVGFDDAVRLLRPHATNAGAAGAQFAMTRLGIEGYDVKNLLTTFKFTHLAMGREDSRIRVCELGGYIDFFSCPFENCSHLNCVFLCDMGGKGGGDLVGPEYEWHLDKSMYDGDEFCRKGLVRKGHSFEEMRREDMRIIEPPPFPVSEEELAWFSRAYYGEFWTIFIRCLIEVADGPGAIELMKPHMKQSGLAFALESREALGLNADDPKTLKEIFSLLFDLLAIKAKWSETESMWTIVECPFSNAEPEIGEQLRIFMNAMVEGFDHRIHLDCEKRMCGGESCCMIQIGQGVSNPIRGTYEL